jgi:hypothetical protein
MITPAQYLQASGTTAICLIQGDDTGCCFKVSRKVDAPGVVATFWIDQAFAVSVARIARNKAGRSQASNAPPSHCTKPPPRVVRY